MIDKNERKIALEFRKVNKKYKQGADEIQILKDVSFNIFEGEIVALVGPSGCGKTTLLQIAGLLDELDSGDVIINSTNTTELSDSKKTIIRRDELGFVYQFHHLLPEFTASENIVIPQIIAKTKKRKARVNAEVLLTKMGLADRGSHRPSELSGGEQQRVAIARAMANNPKLILADEPTGNLDPKTADEVFKTIILQMKMSGFAMLLVTHNMELAQKAHRILTLEDGHIKEL